MNKFKAVLLDIDDTILDFELNSIWSMNKAAETMSISLPDNFIEVFHVINDELWEMIQEGTLTIEQLHKVRFVRVFEACGIDADGLLFEKLFVENLKDASIPVEGAYDLLDYLTNKGYVLYVASNATYDQQVKRLTLAKMIHYFKDLFISEKIGVSKPKAGFFDGCLEKMDGLTKDDMVMIGDSLTADIEGASNYGITTIWFNKKKADKVSDKATYTVLSLKEIEEIL